MALFLLFPVFYSLYAPVCVVCMCVSLCLSVLSWAVGIVPLLCLLASALTSALIAHCCDFLQWIILLFYIDFPSAALVQYFILFFGSILFISCLFLRIINIQHSASFRICKGLHIIFNNLVKIGQKQIIQRFCVFFEILLSKEGSLNLLWNKYLLGVRYIKKKKHSGH